MKVCFKCGAGKPLSEFYKHPKMADGHVNKCKECNKIDVRENRANKLKYYREYDRKRGSRQSADCVKEYRKAYPNKYSAHCKVNNAIRDGRLQRGTECETCGSEENLVAHHDDYLKPLDVRWMCQACHVNWHKENGEAKNST